MRMTSSRAYGAPPPVPKMPDGLVELMQGMSREVLKNNPTDIYEFCSNHMSKLLELRDGQSRPKPLTLEEKIVKAQEKVRQRAKERRERFDKEFQLLFNRDFEDPCGDEDQKIRDAEKIVNKDMLSLKAPVHHENDLQDESEIEISHTKPVRAILPNNSSMLAEIKTTNNITESVRENLETGTANAIEILSPIDTSENNIVDKIHDNLSANNPDCHATDDKLDNHANENHTEHHKSDNRSVNNESLAVVDKPENISEQNEIQSEDEPENLENPGNDNSPISGNIVIVNDKSADKSIVDEENIEINLSSDKPDNNAFIDEHNNCASDAKRENNTATSDNNIPHTIDGTTGNLPIINKPEIPHAEEKNAIHNADDISVRQEHDKPNAQCADEIIERHLEDSKTVNRADYNESVNEFKQATSDEPLLSQEAEDKPEDHANEILKNNILNDKIDNTENETADSKSVNCPDDDSLASGDNPVDKVPDISITNHTALDVILNDAVDDKNVKHDAEKLTTDGNFINNFDVEKPNLSADDKLFKRAGDKNLQDDELVSQADDKDLNIITGNEKHVHHAHDKTSVNHTADDKPSNVLAEDQPVNNPTVDTHVLKLVEDEKTVKLAGDEKPINQTADNKILSIIADNSVSHSPTDVPAVFTNEILENEVADDKPLDYVEGVESADNATYDKSGNNAVEEKPVTPIAKLKPTNNYSDDNNSVNHATDDEKPLRTASLKVENNINLGDKTILEKVLGEVPIVMAVNNIEVPVESHLQTITESSNEYLEDNNEVLLEKTSTGESTNQNVNIQDGQSDKHEGLSKTADLGAQTHTRNEFLFTEKEENEKIDSGIVKSHESSKEINNLNTSATDTVDESLNCATENSCELIKIHITVPEESGDITQTNEQENVSHNVVNEQDQKGIQNGSESDANFSNDNVPDGENELNSLQISESTLNTELKVAESPIIGNSNADTNAIGDVKSKATERHYDIESKSSTDDQYNATENALQSLSHSTGNNTAAEINTAEAESSKTNDEVLNNPNSMNLETAAITIQKVFRSFMFKSRNSTFDDTAQDDSNSIDVDEDSTEKKDEYYAAANLNKERRPLGITRMDTVLQTVNEEKSLSLSTDESSTLSSAATTIQAHVRGFLVRNRMNSNKTLSMNSLVNSHEVLEFDPEQQKNKTVLNIHIVPEQGNYFSRDESFITSMDLSLDGSPPSSVNLHPLSYDTSERRKMLKREDAVQSVSPPSNNSGKLSEESVKEVLLNDSDELADNKTKSDEDQTNDLDNDTSDLISDSSATPITEIHVYKNEDVSPLEPDDALLNSNSDEADVITPSPRSKSENNSKLEHSGEFHDVVLPTKISRNDTSVVRGE